MKFDRNTVIGFVVLAVLFIGYFYFTTQDQKAFQKEKARQDSIARAQQAAKVDSNLVKKDEKIADSFRNVTETGRFEKSTTEKTVVVSNSLMNITFTTRGGQPRGVELKNFKNLDSTLVKLAASDFDRFGYTIMTGNGKTANIKEINFDSISVTGSERGTQIVSIPLISSDTSGNAGPSIIHEYTIRPNDYMIDFNVKVNGADQLFTESVMNITWQRRALQLEKDLAYEKEQSQIGYVLDGDYDYHTIARRTSKEFGDPVQWVAVKQQFFNTSMIAKENFASGRMEWNIPPSEKGIVVEATANLRMNVKGSNSTLPLALYYGPNDYKLLKGYGMEMENLVNLGTGIFAFVKYLNRWIVMPIFDLLSGLTSNYGIVILLLTVFIRLLIAPLNYSSYLSSAKMKVLKPEIEALRAKYGGDQQQMGVEQMKLFREAGVNPFLGGCIPALLQIPIFFALFAFFSSSVDLRGEPFLWSNDLSSYDSIYQWTGFSIPFYGSHVSLFTITAVITSFLISIYSMNMTPDQNNPILKWMPYIFPFFMLFIFNRLPSGLTWYYTVSNVITLALQFVIQNYIINHEKILAKMQENRKKPKPKSKFQEQLEKMQEAQKKAKEMQQKGKR